jgi:hypothetical protein
MSATLLIDDEVFPAAVWPVMPRDKDPNPTAEPVVTRDGIKSRLQVPLRFPFL